MHKDKYEGPTHRNRGYTIMSKEDIAKGKKSAWKELELTGNIIFMSPGIFKFRHLTALYANNNLIREIPAGIVQLVNLTHLDLSYNKLRLLPPEMGDMVELRELLLGYNHIRYLPNELGKLFQLQQLVLTGNPLSNEVLVYLNDVRGIDKLLENLLEGVPFTCGQPPQRPWLSLATPERQKPVVHYTTMCYNVLCDKYATRQLYGYCPSWALAWEYRKKGIIEEIRHYAADIITLQEVETDQYEKFFKVELEKDGYDGIFAPKSRARSMSEVDKKHVDGCAIFFRTRKFALVQEHLIEFNQLAMDKAEGSHEMLNRVMTKDNIALAALLETKREAWINGVPAESQIKQQILVTTCHVHWDPEFSDVKLVQTMMLMAEIKNILDKHSTNLRPGATSNDANSTPLLLCGDLNSLPDSGVLEYLTKGRVAGDHKDFKELGYQKCLQKMNMSEKKDFYTHAFKLDQAYHRQQLPYTNYTFDFKGIIDYIFHSADTIRPLGVLGALDQDWFLDNKVLGCPHPHIPSDHIPLLVEFEMSGKVDMVPSMAAGGGQQHQEQQQQPPPSNVAAGQSRR